MSASPSITAASAISVDARRLVLGAAVGFRVDQVCIFIESLRSSGYDGDVVMLVGPAQWRLCAYLRRHGVRTVSTWSTRKLHGPIHAYRFEKFAKLVRAAQDRYDYVLTSDVRDVVFQRHPFEESLHRSAGFILKVRLGHLPPSRSTDAGPNCFFRRQISRESVPAASLAAVLSSAESDQ